MLEDEPTARPAPVPRQEPRELGFVPGSVPESFFDDLPEDELRLWSGDPAVTPPRLAIYGSLAPGRPNHHQISGLTGRWITGRVAGRLVQEGWGAALGYPGLVLEPDGATVDVEVLESEDLPAHWERLDTFEGAGYARVLTTVRTVEGDLDAWIYVLAPRAAE